MSFIYSNQQTVDLIICDVFFPTEDSLLILQEVTLKFDIPTVSKFLHLYYLSAFSLNFSVRTKFSICSPPYSVMSLNGDTATVMKYITNGASDFLIKPLRIEELKNIWQHVFRKKIGAERRKCSNDQHIDQMLYQPMGITEATATLDSDGIRGNSGTVTDIRDLRKSRLSWTMQLHRQFIAAVNSLGTDSECSISFFSCF